MGILSNLLGSRKKEYKKGLQDAMNAYEAFGNKQERALNKIREEVQSGNKRMEEMLTAFGEDINDVYDYLTDQEKMELYNLCTPFDIKDFDDYQKRVILAFLYQLYEDEDDSQTTDYQRKYIKSVQKYIEITNPQIEIDLETIDNIDSLDLQKAIYQVILEFLFLQKKEFFSISQVEFLDAFALSKKQKEQIEQYVVKMYKVLGKDGLSEKYGFICEENIESSHIKRCTVKGIEVGNIIKIGKWEEEDIDWYIAAIENNEAVLISENIYDMGPYSDHNNFVTWERCRLRKYLNNEFFERAFSEEEKLSICDSEVDTGPSYGEVDRKSAGPNTVDKIFILNQKELHKYLGYSDHAQYPYTLYGQRKEWWIREPICSTDDGKFHSAHAVSALSDSSYALQRHPNDDPGRKDKIHTRLAMRIFVSNI